MININDINVSFILTSSEINGISLTENSYRNNLLLNMLYSLDYSVIPIYGYENNVYEKNYIAVTYENNDKLREESIFILNKFNKDHIYVKYKGETNLTKINFDGTECPINVNYYDQNFDRKSYIYEGISFTLNEKRRHFFPKKKEELKQGMLIEYFNNNIWSQKKVVNLDSEYEKMYKLLMKYEKIRVCY